MVREAHPGGVWWVPARVCTSERRREPRLGLRRSGYRVFMRLHDPLIAARHAAERLPLDRLPVEQLRTVPELVRSIPDQVASKLPHGLGDHLPDAIPDRVRRRLVRIPGLPRRVRATLQPRRRRMASPLVVITAVALAVAGVLLLRWISVRADRLLTDEHSSRDVSRVPDSAPASTAETLDASGREAAAGSVDTNEASGASSVGGGAGARLEV